MIYILFGALALLWILAPLRRRKDPLMIPAKWVLIILTLFGLAWGTSNVAQELKAVDPGAGLPFNPVVIVLIILGVGAFVLYIWHRKHPANADKALLEAHADLSAFATKVNDLLPDLVATIEEHVKTIAEQAKVIAGKTESAKDAEAALLAMGASHEAMASLQTAPVAPETREIDAEMLQAAREYRVAYASYGANDPRTLPYLSHLASLPHWSDALVYAGGAGFDAKAEQAIAEKLSHG